MCLYEEPHGVVKEVAEQPSMVPSNVLGGREGEGGEVRDRQLVQHGSYVV